MLWGCGFLQPLSDSPVSLSSTCAQQFSSQTLRTGTSEPHRLDHRRAHPVGWAGRLPGGTRKRLQLYGGPTALRFILSTLALCPAILPAAKELRRVEALRGDPVT